MDEVIEVIDSDDEESLPSTTAPPHLVQIKTDEDNNLPNTALNAGSLTKLVINPKINPGNASLQYWDCTKLITQRKNVGETADTAQKVLTLQTSQVRTVHNTIIRKLVPNQRANLLLPTGQAVDTGPTANATTSGNSSADAVLGGQNTNLPTVRKLNLPAATVGGSVRFVNASNRATAVGSVQMPYITFRANINSTSQVANPRIVSTVASLRGNKFVPSTYSTNMDNTTNAIIRHRYPIKYLPQTISRRAVEIKSERPPVAAYGSPAQPTRPPIYRNIIAPVRNPKLVALPATPTGIASQNQIGTPRLLGALMNLPDSAIRSKPFTVGNKTLSFNMAGNNYTIKVNKTSSQDVIKNNVHMFTGSTAQYAPTTTSTDTSTTSGSSVTTAPVAELTLEPPPLTILKTNVNTTSQHSLLKNQVTPNPQSADLPSISSASTTVKIETSPQQQNIKRSRKSALGPSLACDDFEILTLSPESPKTRKKLRKSSPNSRSLLKSHNAAASNETYEYSHKELSNLNVVFRNFIFKPEIQHQMRIIAEERARINYMLSSCRLPQIQFKNFSTEEGLRHDLQKSLKTQNIELFPLAVVDDNMDTGISF
ncbi:uncharacterized protein LOC119661987 [Teleopsis dalmanni]|uniref:uncharacterized protein LOC119661987 n=1 Tax=Teleopsis dalmanni TaxID=139649 RepID=UPI0018CFBC55|nr:uncharacterized protein LOC119661987 [Teleopsis dalmanni]XP_037927448.1 uncharacterized protein LOC119661987 [Teleopsis dalmanni]